MGLECSGNSKASVSCYRVIREKVLRYEVLEAHSNMLGLGAKVGIWDYILSKMVRMAPHWSILSLGVT